MTDTETMTTLKPIRDGAWLARSLLTPEEQDSLRTAAEAAGRSGPAAAAWSEAVTTSMAGSEALRRPGGGP